MTPLEETIATGPPELRATWTPDRIAAEKQRQAAVAAARHTLAELRQAAPQAIIEPDPEQDQYPGRLLVTCPYCGGADLQVQYDALDLREITKVHADAPDVYTLTIAGCEMSDSEPLMELYCCSCQEISTQPAGIADIEYE